MDQVSHGSYQIMLWQFFKSTIDGQEMEQSIVKKVIGGS